MHSATNSLEDVQQRIAKTGKTVSYTLVHSINILTQSIDQISSSCLNKYER